MSERKQITLLVKVQQVRMYHLEDGHDVIARKMLLDSKNDLGDFFRRIEMAPDDFEVIEEEMLDGLQMIGLGELESPETEWLSIDRVDDVASIAEEAATKIYEEASAIIRTELRKRYPEVKSIMVEGSSYLGNEKIYDICLDFENGITYYDGYGCDRTPDNYHEEMAILDILLDENPKNIIVTN